jgi:hypothetical protein
MLISHPRAHETVPRGVGRRTFSQMKDSDMNTGSRTRASLIGCALFLSVGVQSAAIADTGDADSAAKLSQSPIANVISVPPMNVALAGRPDTSREFSPTRDGSRKNSEKEGVSSYSNERR